MGRGTGGGGSRSSGGYSSSGRSSGHYSSSGGSSRSSGGYSGSSRSSGSYSSSGSSHSSSYSGSGRSSGHYSSGRSSYSRSGSSGRGRRSEYSSYDRGDYSDRGGYSGRGGFFSGRNRGGYSLGDGCGTGCGGGCVTYFFIFVILCSIMKACASDIGTEVDNPTQQVETIAGTTTDREKLPEGCVHETAYYTDHLGYIESESKLTKGMIVFYEKTGVQPYLYLATDAEIDAAGGIDLFTDGLYDQLFTDEAHFLMVYNETLLSNGDGDGDWQFQYVTGLQAYTVIDDEAVDIIYNRMLYFYEDSSLDDESFFSKVFEDSAEVLMK